MPLFFRRIILQCSKEFISPRPGRQDDNRAGDTHARSGRSATVSGIGRIKEQAGILFEFCLFLLK